MNAQANAAQNNAQGNAQANNDQGNAEGNAQANNDQGNAEGNAQANNDQSNAQGNAQAINDQGNAQGNAQANNGQGNAQGNAQANSDRGSQGDSQGNAEDNATTPEQSPFDIHSRSGYTSRREADRVYREGRAREEAALQEGIRIATEGARAAAATARANASTERASQSAFDNNNTPVQAPFANQNRPPPTPASNFGVPISTSAPEVEYLLNPKYRAKPTVHPTFNGNETLFLPFLYDCTTYLRQRGIPNHLMEYTMSNDTGTVAGQRFLPSHWTPEQAAADHELYDLLHGWLDGKAKKHIKRHVLGRSGHQVWKDLCDQFLARSHARMSQLEQKFGAMEIESKESMPDFFARAEDVVTKYRAVGGDAILSDQRLLLKISKCFALCTSSNKDSTTWREWDKSLMTSNGQPGWANPTLDAYQKAMENNEERRRCLKDHQKNQDDRSISASARQAIAEEAVTNYVQSNGSNRGPPGHGANSTPLGNRDQRQGYSGGQNGSQPKRPWEEPQRKPYDKSGIGARSAPTSNPNKKPWQSWKGANKEAALAQVHADYQSQLAAVQGSSFAVEAADAFEAGLQSFSSVVTDDSNDNPYCGMFVADDPDEVASWLASDNDFHVVMNAESRQTLMTACNTDDELTMDSGTTHNVFRLANGKWTKYVKCNVAITHAGSKKIFAIGKGTYVETLVLPCGRTITHEFTNSLHVPGASRDLISTHELEEQGHEIRFKKGASVLIFKNGIRLPLTTKGRLRMLPLFRPAAPKLRAGGWNQTFTGTDSRDSATASYFNPDQAPIAAPTKSTSEINNWLTDKPTSGGIHPSRLTTFKKAQLSSQKKVTFGKNATPAPPPPPALRSRDELLQMPFSPALITPAFVKANPLSKDKSTAWHPCTHGNDNAELTKAVRELEAEKETSLKNAVQKPTIIVDELARKRALDSTYSVDELARKIANKQFP